MLRTILRSLVLCLILNAGILHTYVVSADQEVFPFLAEVTGDQVSVRAGQSANFERLCQLDKGEEVIVLEKAFSWYKIQLPPSANSFVHKSYVQFLGQNAGGILGDRVNIRAGAGVDHTVLGQLTKGEQIYIEEESGEWYRIQPVVNSYGWVADQFLKFKSSDVTGHITTLTAKTFIDLEILEPAEKELPEEKTEDTAVEKKTEEADAEEGKKVATWESGQSFYAAGYVEEYKDGESDDIHYKITAGGRPVCYVQGQNQMLGRFKNLRVSVEGTINQRFQPKYAYPVVVVSKIRLML